jgi:hypothetical protein
MKEVVYGLVKRLVEEAPTRMHISRNIITPCYIRDNRKYSINAGSDWMEFYISDNDNNILYELLIEDERTRNEIRYKLEDWAKIFEHKEIELLEDNIKVEKPQGMESLLEETDNDE